MQMQRRAQWKAFFTVAAWATSFIVTKLVLRTASPVTIVWLRLLIGGGVLGVIVMQRGEFAWPSLRELALLAMLGAQGITLHQWLQSNGLVTAQASTTAWIVATGPVFIALLGGLVLRESLSGRQVSGIALAALGVVLVVSKGDLAAVFRGSFGVRGDWLILATAPNWAIFTIISRKALPRIPAARMMLFVLAFGWLFTNIEYFAGGHLEEIPGMSLNAWLGIAFLGVFATGLAYVAWYDALKELPASQVGVFLYVGPLVSMVIAALVLGERITTASMLGGGMILFGVWVVNRHTAPAG